MAKSRAFGPLRAWAMVYVRYRDTAKRITGIKETDYGFEISSNDGMSSECFILPSLAEVGAASGRAGIIVTLSNEENIKHVYKHWDSLSANSSLLMIFANPFSLNEEKWLLKPHLHSLVADRGSLLQGLKAMAELVDPISEEAFAEKSQQAVAER